MISIKQPSLRGAGWAVDLSFRSRNNRRQNNPLERRTQAVYFAAVNYAAIVVRASPIGGLTVIAFPRTKSPNHPDLIVRNRPCLECGNNMAMLRRYPLNRAVSWCCTCCQAVVRSCSRLFVSHHELRSCGIEPDRLPEVRRLPQNATD